jgi:hypothetical protein
MYIRVCIYIYILYVYVNVCVYVYVCVMYMYMYMYMYMRMCVYISLRGVRAATKRARAMWSPLNGSSSPSVTCTQ